MVVRIHVQEVVEVDALVIVAVNAMAHVRVLVDLVALVAVLVEPDFRYIADYFISLFL